MGQTYLVEEAGCNLQRKNNSYLTLIIYLKKLKIAVRTSVKINITIIHIEVIGQINIDHL